MPGRHIVSMVQFKNGRAFVRALNALLKADIELHKGDFDLEQHGFGSFTVTGDELQIKDVLRGINGVTCGVCKDWEQAGGGNNAASCGAAK